MPQLAQTFRATASATGEEGAETYAGDMFLAAAALTGQAAAVSELTRSCWPVALRYLRRVAAAPADLEDIGQELWEVLLVGAEAGGPKLANYSGRGPLAAFVGITAQRIAIMRFRRNDAAARAVRAAAEVEALTLDPELAIIKERFRPHFQDALGQAMQRLDDRTRMVLSMHVVDRVTIERIAQAYSVCQSTVSRWLEKARQRVARETYRELARRLQLSESDFDAIRKLVLSQLHMSMSGLLTGP
jgi:RNA polymerase sigma-70 factor